MEPRRLEGLHALPLALAGVVLSMGGSRRARELRTPICGRQAFRDRIRRPPAPFTPVVSSSASDFWSTWAAVAERARATQPAWSSPLVTTSRILEQRVRFDMSEQHAGDGANTLAFDGGRGLDLIISGTNKIQIAAPPYDIRSTPNGKGDLNGFGDWAFVRSNSASRAARRAAETTFSLPGSRLRHRSEFRD